MKTSVVLDLLLVVMAILCLYLFVASSSSQISRDEDVCKEVSGVYVKTYSEGFICIRAERIK